MTYEEMAQKQSLPYKLKVMAARARAWEFYNKIVGEGHDVHVSVGGLDSITLYCFLKSIGLNVHGISVSSLEDKSIQRVHKELGIEVVRPYKSKLEVNGWNCSQGIIRNTGRICIAKKRHSRSAVTAANG